MFEAIQYRLLRKFYPRGSTIDCGHVWSITRATENGAGDGSLLSLFGEDFGNAIIGRRVVDFGCGQGRESCQMAAMGAAYVIGVDIRGWVLEAAKERAHHSGLTNCHFVETTKEKADVILSKDAFEHFDNPAGILETMDSLLLPHGRIFISFGPTWLHPYGGHTFSVFPWAHLLLSERALLRWRSDFKTDGAKSFGEVEGGLNQITISRFTRIVKSSAFHFESFSLVPISRLAPVHNSLTREFTTSVVRCVLRRNR